MLTTIFLFAAAVFAVAIMAPLLSIPLMPLVAPARSVRALAPVATGLLAALSVAAAMVLFLWLARSLGREPSVWMFLIAFLLMMRNDLDRIHRAWVGKTPVRDHLEAQGERYDSRLQAHMEVASLVGDTLGLWLVFIIAVNQ